MAILGERISYDILTYWLGGKDVTIPAPNPPGLADAGPQLSQLIIMSEIYGPSRHPRHIGDLVQD